MVLFLLALAWLLGIATAALTGAEPAALVIAASLFASILFAVRPGAASLALALGSAVLMIAAGVRYDDTRPDTDPPLAAFNDSGDVLLRAVVSEAPDERANGSLYRLDVREIRSEERWTEIPGRVLMRGPVLPAYEYGDLLEVHGELEAPPVFEDFDYRDYLLRQGITSIIAYPETRVLATDQGSAATETLIGIRSRLERSLETVLPQPQASLAAGILYGSRSAMPQGLKDDMNTTGTSHLAAVSGQNVALVAGLIVAALAWLIGRRPAAWAALFAIGGYMLLVGLEPSVLRAGIMGAVFIAAILTGRQNTGWVALAYAAALMTLADPQVVRDASFQLSAAATLGLVTLAGPLREAFNAALARQPRLTAAPFSAGLLEVATVTVVAILFTLPITALTFGRVSFVALPANLFAVPAFLVVAFTSAIASGVTLLIPDAAGVMAWLAWPPAAYMTSVIHIFAALPAASIGLGGLADASIGHGDVTAGPLLAGAWYAGLAAFTVWLSRRRIEDAPAPLNARATRPGTRFVLAAATVAGVALLAGFLLAGRPSDGRLTVTFLDVGQGDAALIEGPGGNRVLIDAGPGGEAIDAALGRVLPFDDRRIDLVVATHPDADHTGGLPEVIDLYDVRGVLTTAVEADTTFYAAWKGAIAASGMNASLARPGDAIELGGGARIDILAPDEADPLLQQRDTNDTSIVLRLSMGDVSFLLTGDLAESGEAIVASSGADLNATVLKVGHHGSRTSSTPEFLARVGPLVDVISVGASNPHGHPAPEVLHRLDGGQVYRTDEQGDVTISTDGNRLWVSTQR